ncbi:hypothetical protein [Paenibacillus marinisediminis]
MSSFRNVGAIVLTAVLLLVTACNGATEAAKPQQQESASKTELPSTPQEAAATVVAMLHDGNMEGVAALAHPDKGVRFSPYAYVNIETDIVLSKDELKDAMSDAAVRKWGAFDGSGEPIEMTYADYHKRFVYDADYMKNAGIAMNKVLQEGNTINNVSEAYPKDSHDFVEYHIKGIDPSLQGIDWRSLRLVFEKIEGGYALVGIIHDQWTI